MRNQFHIPFLIIFISSILISNCSSTSEKQTINNEFDAISQAGSFIYTTRMTFTQGEPDVIFVKEMTLVEAKDLIPKEPNAGYSSEDRPDNTTVWLVIFEGSWQIHPPNGDLLPLESGCIYTIVDAINIGRNIGIATNCRELP